MAATHRNRLVTAISNAPGSSGALTISTASSGYRTFGAADDGLSFDVSIVDGTAWEIRTGCVYSNTGTSLARGTLEDSSTGSAISLTSSAVVTATMSAGRGNSLGILEKAAIAGLQMQWVSASAITIATGGAFIESLGRVYEVPTAIALTGLTTLTASTLYHVYLYDNAGTPAAEVVTTAPATAYFASARSKTSDTTRRYLGSVYVNASQQISAFQHHAESGLVVYRNASGSTPSLRILNGGTATTNTAVACSAFVPTTSRDVSLKVSNTNATYNVYVGSFEDSLSTTVSYVIVAPTQRSFFACPTDSSQRIGYLVQDVTCTAYIDLLGYWYTR